MPEEARRGLPEQLLLLPSLYGQVGSQIDSVWVVVLRLNLFHLLYVLILAKTDAEGVLASSGSLKHFRR